MRKRPSKISALVFDLDGTAIPKVKEGMPTQTVIEAVLRAKECCHVSIATGRPLSICESILDALNIDDLCILNGGTHVYSRKTSKYIWKQEMDHLLVQQAFGKITQMNNYLVADEKHMERVPIKEYSPNEPIALSCIFSTSKEDSVEILSTVNQVKGLSALALSSWKDGTYDVHITHELASKKHALQALLAHLNVHLDEVMVVGDGGNDLPLFELAGWRVAMGNAADELKAQADWIAPHVDEDGLAVAINTFILKK